MSSMKTFCAVALVAALAVVAGERTSHAGFPLPLSFEVEADGFFIPTTPNTFEISSLVTFQDPSLGFNTLDAVVLIDWVGNTGTLTGQLELDGTMGMLFLELEGVIHDLGGFASSSGTWTVKGGTGSFDGLTGEGVHASFMNLTTGSIHTHLGGLLIPAPGALALLGIGAIMGSRRRRRV